ISVLTEQKGRNVIDVGGNVLIGYDWATYYDNFFPTYLNTYGYVAPTNGLLVDGQVGIGQKYPFGMLHVLSNSTILPTLIIQDVTSQTADLQDWQNSSGINVSSITARGTFSGAILHDPETISWFASNAPIEGKAGEDHYCIDCTYDLVCISTGTAVGAWAGMQSLNRTTPCN